MKAGWRKQPIAIIGAVAGLAFTALVVSGTLKLYRIPTGGMSPTVQPGDYLLATRSFRAARDFEHGDLVIFSPPDNPQARYVQRIVALSGDRIDLIDGHLAVNGETLVSPGGLLSSPAPDGFRLPLNPQRPLDLSRPPSYPLHVPADHFFVLGDNYANSLDSRYFGTLKAESVTHIPRRIALPLSRMGALE